MNRLIIIGNGFDLAHGLKTSYKDFVLDYLCEYINKFNSNLYYSDECINIAKKNSFRIIHSKANFKLTPEETLDFISKKLNINDAVDFKINSSIISKSLSKIDNLNWVDLEIEYFNELIFTKNLYQTNPNKIKYINNQLEFLKQKLIEYLKEQQSNFIHNFNKKPLIDSFTESVYSKEVVTIELKKNERPKNLFFLNFNYTNTFETYYDECRKIIPSEFDYIHGDLNDGQGSPIFGFGDELDKRYLEFEDEKNNELFRHIKSFEYLKNKNYYRLIRFLESDDYQVQIYGHSCGLSDRTMLNTIFENEKCKSIKIFYHEREDGTNDYTEKTYEISRHFKDKGIMRKKIVPYDYSKAMPQPKK